MHAVPILGLAESERARALVHALRSSWTQRSPLPFFTLGAATYLDATHGRQSGYLSRAAELNPVLREHFAWLHHRVFEALEAVSGCRVALAPHLAVPGFHIFLAHPAFIQPLAAVHFDLQYREHEWSTLGEPEFSRPISFTLPISVPTAGTGLLTWPRELGPGHGVSDADMAALLRQTPPHYVPYTVGTLAVHDGHLAHQIAPPARIGPGDERITLQGHALRCGDTYFAYW